MIVQQVKKEVKFEFKDLPIVMLENKDIYHKEKQKVINQKLNCRSVGYWVDRRFYTLSKLNKLAVKTKDKIVVKELIDCPF
jgi:hypothetical protein